MGKAVVEQLLADLAGLAAPEDAKQRFAELIGKAPRVRELLGSIGRNGCSSLLERYNGSGVEPPPDGHLDYSANLSWEITFLRSSDPV